VLWGESEGIMSQRVIITTEADVEMRPLVQSALAAELRTLTLGLARTRQRLSAFEERYHMTSDEFAQRFTHGELEDSLDFVEWAGEVKTYQLLEAQKNALQQAQVV
jgi:hypothetical protein